MVIELVRKDAAMLKDDPYDTSVEKPVRGGGHKVARGVVRTCAFVVRFCIMALAILAVFNLIGIATVNLNHDTMLAEHVLQILERFWSLVPWGHITALDINIGEQGIFYADVFIPMVICIILDGILDKAYDKLK